MPTINNSINISAPVEKVFAYLSDPRNSPEWVGSLSEVTDVTGSGVGQHYHWKYNMLGVPLRGETTVSEHVPNERRGHRRAKEVSPARARSPSHRMRAGQSWIWSRLHHSRFPSWGSSPNSSCSSATNGAQTCRCRTSRNDWRSSAETARLSLRSAARNSAT